MSEKKEKSARVRAAEKYDKKMAKPMSLKFNAKTDKRLLAYLEGIKNRQGYIKALILADLKKLENKEDCIATDYAVDESIIMELLRKCDEDDEESDD